MYKSVPTRTPDGWIYTDFETKEEFRDFVKGLFKEPGKYNFNETSLLFNEQSRGFMESSTNEKRRIYCSFPDMSRDYINYWETEKEKCREGVIFVPESGERFYLTRDYYMYLNFLPIFDKEKGIFTFPTVWDSQYHSFIYDILAQLHDNHIVKLKKRQWGNTYMKDAKIINLYWFEEGVTLKIGASLKDYINEKGAWKFLDQYRSFLNTYTAWYRHNEPDKVFSWQQKIKVRQNGRDTFKGLKGTITGTSFESDATAGVGGNCHRLGTLILMADGKFKKVEDIEIGEFVLGIDDSPKKVLKKIQGQSDLFRVVQTRGSDYYTTGDHTLYLINRDKKVSEKTKERLTKTKDWNSLTTYQKRCYVGVKNYKPLEFYNNLKTPTLDPYFLGAWIGDGYRSGAAIIINKTKDFEILEYLQELSLSTGTSLSVIRKESNRYNDEMYSAYFSISENGEDTVFTKNFVKYNLYYNKHIPDEFLYGSVSVRLQLLAGYIDTDGYYDSEHAHFEVSCKSKDLITQIAFLCRSLGGIVRESVAASQEHELEHGNIIKYTETNRLSVYFQDTSIIPTKVERKKGKNYRERNIHTSPIKEICCIGKENYAGIEVENHLYYLEDLTIAHNCTLFYHEEAGIAPKLDKTFEYMLPALSSGDVMTGQFIASGSVGDLDQCRPLKEMILNPEKNKIYPVFSNLLDENGKEGYTGLFIPEQWSMSPYIDEYGNSQVERALEAIHKKREQDKKDLSPEKYQLRISQHPINIKEAFDIRTVSIFPVQHTTRQLKRIQEKTYYVEHVDLQRNEKNEIVKKHSNKQPISEFPLPKGTEDKTGIICIHEDRILDDSKQVPWGTYYGSVDCVEGGKTHTSDSLASIYIYKTAIEVCKSDGGTNEKGEEKFTTHIEGDKLVAWWTGRFDDSNATNERMRLLVEYYNAWTIVENNKGSFINYMIAKNCRRYLAHVTDVLFDKELEVKQNVWQQYGWTNTTKLWDKMLTYGVEFLKEELDITTDKAGKIISIKFGVERIPDPILLVEMQQFEPKGNFDRIIAFVALVAFVAIQKAQRGIRKKIVYTEKELENREKLSKLTMRASAFRNVGRDNRFNRSAFRNIK